MQSKEELESWHSQKDAWGYEQNPEDLKRKERLLSYMKTYKRALDIGACEGFITKDIPAKEIHAIEISDLAASRFPKNITRVHKPEGKYDLILATGIMYQQYDHQTFIEWIKNHACGTVILSNIKDWEVDLSPLGEPIYTEEYPYREYTQKLRIYDFTP